jgi:hypothetical protein
MARNNLGGEILSPGETTPPTNRDLNVMQDARQMLTQQTGRGFGFDLAGRHNFLLNDASCRKSIRSTTPGRRSSSGSMSYLTIPTAYDSCVCSKSVRTLLRICGDAPTTFVSVDLSI